MENRGVGFLFRGQRPAQTEMRRYIAVAQTQRALVMVDRLVDLSAHKQNSAESRVRDIAVRRNRESMSP